MKPEVGMQHARGIRGRAISYVLVLTGAVCVLAIGAQSASALPPQITKPATAKVTPTTAVLEATINPQGIKTGFHFEYGTEDCAANPCAGIIPVPDGDAEAGSSPLRKGVLLEGLTPATVYHFIAVAKNELGETVKSPDRVFATLSASPFAGLPNGRAYEQATPVDKDGGDAVGEGALVRAASVGGGITFGSTFGIPGGVGAQALPTYLARRGAGQSGWSTKGLLPPPEFGERARMLGWLPDFSQTFVGTARLGSPREFALVAEPASGAPTMIGPFAARSEYIYAGAGSGASTVVFESDAKLPTKEGGPLIPGTLEGASNVYAWDKASKELRLASIFNDKTTPPKGSFAGPYNWLAGISARTLEQGGAARSYYLQDEHAIAENGDTYFTEAGTGQLYLRQNPTQEQSEMIGEECEDPAKACTLHVSASKRATPDPAGAQPAAFQAASTDGSKAFFTSPEKLTDNANTGPIPPTAAIGLGGIGGGIENANFIPQHAVGVTTDSEYVYWADPSLDAIGRAKLNGEDVKQTFIPVGPGECETEAHPKEKPGVFEKVTVPSTPRYVAVDAGHIYWTNSGRRASNGEPLEGGGTIGRADIDGNEPSIDPDFICGEVSTSPGEKLVSNPQGIAVNASHIYWANAAQRSIARAKLNGEDVEGEFFEVKGGLVPQGVGLSATHVYFASNEVNNDNSFIGRVPLEGGAEEILALNKSVLRGVAVDSANVYWAAQGTRMIGRIPIADFPVGGGCGLIVSCEEDFTKEIDGTLNGLAVDSAHLYWSINGEAPGNPGNDLYRYEPDGEVLTDLTPDPGDKDGADVQGVLGVAPDGSRLYFAANGDLDGVPGPAKAGNCQTSSPHGSMGTLKGNCNLYLWEEGAGSSFVARLEGGSATSSDARNWAATTLAVFGAVVPKTSFTDKDARTLLFRSQEKLTAYDNEGVPELYRFQAGDPEGIRCVSCDPGGEAVGEGPSLGSLKFPKMAPLEGASFSTRNLSADGNRAFFETAESLVPADTNGDGGCPTLGTSAQFYRACLDVYEWEAAGTTGQCQKGSPAYSPLNAGCLYLISSGKSEFPSLIADASESGEDVFFFTRQGLVGQDKDELQDVYDARVGGGLASQNAVAPVPCEAAESCHGPAQTPPAEGSPATPTFVGPANPKTKKPKAKKKHSKGKKHHGKKQKKASSKGRTGR